MLGKKCKLPSIPFHWNLIGLPYSLPAALAPTPTPIDEVTEDFAIGTPFGPGPHTYTIGHVGAGP